MKNITISSAPHAVQKDITVLSVKGFVDTNTAPEFDRAFQTVLAAKRFNIIVDLREVTYISSVGWGIFIGELKRIRTQNGNLVLAAMTPEVEEAYKLLEFDSIIKAFQNVTEAVQKGFARTQGKSSPEKPKGTKVATPVAQAVPAQSQSAPLPEGPRTLQAPKKAGFFDWLFKPLKW